MDIELIAWTQSNPCFSSFTNESDIGSILKGKGVFAENLIEYAGRVCYHSTARMGHAPNFVQDRVKAGHEDICEHVHATVRMRWHENERITQHEDPRMWPYLRESRHLTFRDMTEFFPDDPKQPVDSHDWFVSGNVRAWLQLYRKFYAINTLPFVRAVAPAVFAEFEGGGYRWVERHIPDVEMGEPGWNELWKEPWLRSHEVSDLCRVTLLAYTTKAPGALLSPDGSATFLIEGMSRACSHQLVRHRIASFSQCSQRYIDMKKGEWQAVIPPAIADDPESVTIMNEAWESLQDAYRKLRARGIRKEDARFLLPNACETRMVVSMPIDAWEHFVWLRAVDKAAQWEIRKIGVAILHSLNVIAPGEMQPAMNSLYAKVKKDHA